MNKAQLTEKLIEKMRVLGYKEHWINNTVDWINRLNNVRVDGVGKLIRKMLKVNSKLECSDFIAALRFTNILARHNFKEIQLEPYASGPDIKARWNRKFMYFEVTRRRPEVDEWVDDFDLDNLPLETPENIISKIHAKVRQLKYGEINVVVFWSDTSRVKPDEMSKAFEFIRDEIKRNPGTYNKLSGVLFTENEAINVNRLKQYYLFPNENALRPIGPRLANKLNNLLVYDRKQLERRYARWRRPKLHS